VKCLAVNGNDAIIQIQDPVWGVATIGVKDGQPDSFDAVVFGDEAIDCSFRPLNGPGGPVSSGDIAVVDAPPLPTSN
jgi:hypothetical protein